MKWKILQQKIIDLQGPAYQQEVASGVRLPVDCDFTDELESFSVLNDPVEIQYGGSAATEERVAGFIDTFETRDQIEYLVMKDGTRVRLDRIRRIVNIPRRKDD